MNHDISEPCDADCRRDCPVRRASDRRDSEQSQPWHRLKLQTEPGGLRHYLDGQPVHCGTALELQTVAYRDDDHGTYTVLCDRGVLVRYEAIYRRARPDRLESLEATLYVDVAGYEFTRDVTDGLLFRWPERRR